MSGKVVRIASTVAAATALILSAPLAAAPLPASSSPAAMREAKRPARGPRPERGPRPPLPGDILRIFDNARLYIITNDPAGAELAENLLTGCQHRQKRVITLDEWAKMPAEVRWYVSTVFLVNRELLPDGLQLPEKCTAAGDELYTEVIRSGRDSGVVHEITLSAPDGAWLRQAVEDFRKLSGIPRNPLRRSVHSLAVVPLGGEGAKAAAQPLLETASANRSRLAHLMPPENWQPGSPRLASMDETVLIDRSGVATPLAHLPSPPPGKTIGKNDTVAWRETKPDGKIRVIFSAPSADQLTHAVRQYATSPLSVPETMTLLYTARDLRSVRRVAVAALTTGGAEKDLALHLASRAATELRALDTFEVLERAGLNQVLAEIALEQAGITQSGLSQSKNRTRIRRLAAADALLIVEMNGKAGRTHYNASYERLTPRLGGAPRRPLEPSRLKYGITIPGKENDALLRAATDALLSRAVGTKTDREYKQALNQYNEVTLPQWQAQVDAYYHQQRTRQISWRQKLVAHHSATVSGSLRLVDLTDGLVLWEAPFASTQRHDNITLPPRTVTTSGEDSRPDEADVPLPTGETPETLLTRAGEVALAQGFDALRGTAILPASASGEERTAPESTTAPAVETSGRILDVDGGQILIGMGQTDGIKLGDTLQIRLPDGKTTVRVVVTRVRPRTCDAAFSTSLPALLRARVAVGQAASREKK